MELQPPPTYEETFESQKSGLPRYHETSHCKRTMPIVYFFRRKTAFLFRSEGSLNRYRHKILKKPSDLAESDLPLFEFTETSSFKRMFGRPSYVIYKFGMKRHREASGEKPSSLNKINEIERVPFCFISRTFKKRKIIYTLKYQDDINDPKHILVGDSDNQPAYSGTINDTRFQYISPTGKIDELVLTMDSSKNSSFSQEGVTGVYTTEGRDRVPRKMSKFASLVVSEDSNQLSPSADCISPATLPLLCQGLILNHLIRPIVLDDDSMDPHPNKSEIWDSLETE